MGNELPRKTIVVWRRFGKEHGECKGFRVNPQEVVSAHIEDKLEGLSRTPEADWRWWQPSEDVIIERGDGPRDQIVYYLPRRSLALVWRPGYVNSGREWEWYVHVGDTAYDDERGCWVFTDLFADVLVDADNTTHGVYDLDDLSHALEIGLIGADKVASVLRATQSLVDLIRAGEFPPDEILAHGEFLARLGWELPQDLGANRERRNILGVETMYCVFETRNGWIALARNTRGLTRCTLPVPSREEALESIKAGLSSDAVEDEAAFGDLPGKLKRYFDGERVDFSGVAVDVSGFGPFHAAALLACQRVGYGTVVSYLELARMAGSERAARAAGSAMAGNPMPIIIPCHRVVASGRKIGGFTAGLEWKRSLLEIEGVTVFRDLGDARA